MAKAKLKTKKGKIVGKSKNSLKRTVVVSKRNGKRYSQTSKKPIFSNKYRKTVLIAIILLLIAAIWTSSNSFWPKFLAGLALIILVLTTLFSYLRKRKRR